VTGSITLAISCYTNPELTTITNNTDQLLPLGSVKLGSLYQPRNDEPFTLGNTSVLNPGASITYQSGSGSTPTSTSPGLSSEPIYNNEAAGEGAILTTPYGTLTVLCSAGSGTLAVNSPGQTCRTFGETGKTVCGRFLQYWIDHGGLAINGYPLTDERREMLENGQTYTVQWFERVRMEYHPENSPPNDVLLGQFGRIIHPADPPVAAVAGQHYFSETGHNVPGDFFAYWNAQGGLPQFGFPLSEVFSETLEDGKSYQVQYFERARFERHPENQPPFNILLGQFGRRILAGGATPNPSTSPSPGANCDPGYPTVCIPPPPPDLDCVDISYRNFPVLPPDPHQLDPDRDGTGCET
jgi:hypothetical protein